MASEVLNVLYFFLPAYVANTFACILGKGRPLDQGKNFIDGRRILGDGVTVRGSVSGILCGTMTGLFMAFFDHPFLPSGQFLDIVSLGLLLSSGAILGDALGSFIKRRLKIERGRPAPILDQLNFVVGGLVLASFLVPINLQSVIILFVLTPFGHLFVNTLGYLLKMKDVPW